MDTLPEGLINQEEAIRPLQEKELFKQIDCHSWVTDLKRRVQHYGYRYNYQKRCIENAKNSTDSKKNPIQDLPSWAQRIM